MEECKIVNTCRTCLSCLSDGKQYHSIFMPDDRTGTDVHFSEMVTSFSSVQITLGDGLPEEICADCADKTVMFYWFKLQIEESYAILKKKYAEMQKENREISINEEVINSMDSNVQEFLVTTESNNETAEDTFEAFVDLDCIDSYSEDDHEKPEDKEDQLVNTETSKFSSEEFFCEICDRKFRKQEFLIRHKITHAMKMQEYDLEFDGTFNMDEDDTIIVNDNPDTVYCCDDCKSIFIQKEDLDSHLRICDARTLKYVCQVCFKTFGMKKNLSRHLKQAHSDKNKKISCTKCPKTFKQPEQLNSHHLKVHSGMKPHTCEICFKGFNQISNLKDHMRTHNGEKPFLCSTCGKGFNQLGNLRQHTVRHSGIKAHLCSTCGNGFASKGELSAHLRKHTGARPFVCPICNNGFTTSSSLTKHKRIHSGEKPYECDVCHMKFSRSGILVRHKRTHTGEKPYICKYCGKAFIQSNDLTSHLRIHTGEKPYICHICGQAFRQSSSLKTHKKTHQNQTAKELLKAVKKELVIPKEEMVEAEPVILQEALK